MAELKTKKNTKSVSAFIKKIPDKTKRDDAEALLQIMSSITGEEPALWGTSIIGFGEYYYESERSSQKGTWPLVGFSPRAQNLSIYIMPGVDKYSALLKKLGKYKTGVSCLYIKNLESVHMPTLKKIIERGYKDMKKKYKNNKHL